MVLQCCVCHKLKLKERWKASSTAGQSVTYGYCPKCYSQAKKSIKQEQKMALAMK